MKTHPFASRSRSSGAGVGIASRGVGQTDPYRGSLKTMAGSKLNGVWPTWDDTRTKKDGGRDGLRAVRDVLAQQDAEAQAAMSKLGEVIPSVRGVQFGAKTAQQWLDTYFSPRWAGTFGRVQGGVRFDFEGFRAWQKQIEDKRNPETYRQLASWGHNYSVTARQFTQEIRNFIADLEKAGGGATGERHGVPERVQGSRVVMPDFKSATQGGLRAVRDLLAAEDQKVVNDFQLLRDRYLPRAANLSSGGETAAQYFQRALAPFFTPFAWDAQGNVTGVRHNAILFRQLQKAVEDNRQVQAYQQIGLLAHTNSRFMRDFRSRIAQFIANIKKALGGQVADLPAPTGEPAPAPSGGPATGAPPSGGGPTAPALGGGPATPAPGEPGSPTNPIPVQPGQSVPPAAPGQDVYYQTPGGEVVKAPQVGEPHGRELPSAAAQIPSGTITKIRKLEEKIEDVKNHLERIRPVVNPGRESGRLFNLASAQLEEAVALKNSATAAISAFATQLGQSAGRVGETLAQAGALASSFSGSAADRKATAIEKATDLAKKFGKGIFGRSPFVPVRRHQRGIGEDTPPEGGALDPKQLSNAVSGAEDKVDSAEQNAIAAQEAAAQENAASGGGRPSAPTKPGGLGTGAIVAIAGVSLALALLGGGLIGGRRGRR